MNKHAIPNLLRACDVLKLLSQNSCGLTSAEIEKTLSIPQTTAFRILRTLIYQGFAVKRQSRFYPAAGLFEIGLNALSGNQLRSLSVPVLQQLSQQSGYTSHLAIPSGQKSLILEVCDSPSPVRVASRPGSLADLHCSSTGKIFLAYIFSDHLCDYVKFPKKTRTIKTISNMTQLMRNLEIIRKQGYSLDDQEYHMDIRCLAAPVFDSRSQVIAAIGITAPQRQFPKSLIASIARLVCDSAKQMTNLLGGDFETAKIEHLNKNLSQ